VYGREFPFRPHFLHEALSERCYISDEWEVSKKILHNFGEEPAGRRWLQDIEKRMSHYYRNADAGAKWTHLLPLLVKLRSSALRTSNLEVPA
jgi:hypothetical protein